MKRLILAALAATMLTVPSISQAAPLINPSAPQSGVVQADWKKPVVKKKIVRKHDGFTKKKVVRKYHNGKTVTVQKYRNGQRYSNWKRHAPVRDYHRYGLRKPGRGQEWIRVGNDFLLVSIGNGLIFSFSSH